MGLRALAGSANIHNLSSQSYITFQDQSILY